LFFGNYIYTYNSLLPLRFHSCGVKAKNVTLGVPRIKELIDLTKNMKTPSMKLILRKEYEDRAVDLQCRLIQLTLEDAVENLSFVKEIDFFHSEVSATDAAIANRLRQVMEEPVNFCPWVGRIVLKAASIIQKGLTPAKIGCDIARIHPLHVSTSQESDSVFILRLRPLLLLPDPASDPGNNAEDDLALKAAIKALVLRVCRDTQLQGIKNITGATVTTETMDLLNSSGDIQQETVTMLETQGSCLAAVLRLEYFRSDLCSSNDVHNIYAVLGVEAAAAVLFEQIRQTLTFDGSYTNERHLMLLCFFCTSQSILLPISRHGINRSADSGALSRASFEEVSDQLLEAAAYGDTDFTTAFSPAIMVGQRAANTGTGICHAIATIAEEEQCISSDDDVIFTSIDADIDMLSYQEEFSRIEVPYTDAGCGLGMPAVLQHSFIPKPTNIAEYAPSSPKNRCLELKTHYQPTSPKVT